MKITIIGPASPYRGGIATFNDRLAKALIEEGHEVNIHTFTLQYPSILFPGKTQFSEEEAKHNLPIQRTINSINPFNWINIGNKIRRERPDLVISRFWIPFMGPCFGTIQRLIKRNKHSKIVTIVDNMIPHESRIGDKLFSSYFIKPVDAFITMSKSVLKDLEIFDTEKPRIYTPHPLYDNFGAIEKKEFALQRLGLSTDKKYLLFFGLIRDYKGLDLLIEAFASGEIDKNEYRLIIAGEYYSDKEKYLELIQKHHLEDYIIQADKFIPDSEVAHYFNACDLVVQPYKSATQSGVTQIAYHFHKAMIVTNVGGLGEICPDGKVGYLVNPIPRDITEAILKYFNETDKDIMVDNIIEEKKKYSWEILTKKIENLHQELLRQIN